MGTRLISWACGCVVVAAVLAGGVRPAQAENTHEYLSRIAEVPASSGALLTGGLSGVNAIATGSGDLWVAEQVEGAGVSRVDEFDSSGALVGQLNETAGVTALYHGVALEHATGEVYVGAEKEGAPVVAAFSSAGVLLGTWNGSDTKSGSFGYMYDLAVDNSASLADEARGDVYVPDSGHDVVDVFKPEAGGKETYVTDIPGVEPTESEESRGVSAVAVDEANGDLLVGEDLYYGATNTSVAVVDVYEPTTMHGYKLLRQLTGPAGGAFGQVTGLAVDGGDGDVYVTQGNDASGLPPLQVDQFSEAGVYIGRLTGTPGAAFVRGIGGVAVDPGSGRLYVGQPTPENSEEAEGAVDVFGPTVVIPDVSTGAYSMLAPLSVTLEGTVDSDGAGTASCGFAWGTSTSFGHTASCSQGGIEGSSEVAVSAQLTGLQPDTTYYYRLQATNANGTNPGEESEDRSFTTPGPGLEGTWATKVSASAATLDASIDPHGKPTYYYFQYGTSNVYGEDLPALSEAAPYGRALGAGAGEEQVVLSVAALRPSTTYHYRVVAVSEIEAGKPESFYGPDGAFTTQGSSPVAGVGGLPDQRAWEMVSPPDKQGALIPAVENEDVVQAAADGSAITYRTMTPIEAEPQGYGFYFSQTLSVRGPGGWSSRDITTQRHAGIEGLDGGEGYEYKLFSPDLTQAIVEPYGPYVPLSGEEAVPHATERTQYIRSNQTCQATPATCYTPLVTPADTPPGTAIEGSGIQSYFHGATSFAGATPDLSHIVVHSQVPLTEVPGSTGGLYQWVAGELQLISVLPEREGAGPAGTDVFLGYGTDSRKVARNAISADGSHIVWTEALDGHLYDRDTVTHETVRLDLPQGGDGHGGEEAIFQAATSDGSRVFFTDTQDLTAGAKGNSLYMCEIAESAGVPTCKLSDLTPDLHTGEAADVLGVMPGVSESDGRYVYFVAAGALASGATPHGHNLYVAHEEDGVWTTTFIAGLADGDETDWSGGVDRLTDLTAMVSANGEHLAFMSEEPLTGYDNHDAVGGELDEEVYLYSAGTRQLVCASCNPTGARPRGVSLGGVTGTAVPLLVEGDVPWAAGTWAAAILPGWTPLSQEEGLYQPRYLSNTGRLFFDSSDALVPQDGNGTEDVYEYEPPGKGSEGEGSCETSTEGAADVYSPQAQGCIGLISSGLSSEESVFLDASESGGDVFFLTSEKLVPQDIDDSYDVYDAHECTSAVPCPAAATEALPPCASSDACKPGGGESDLQPGIFGASGSATFSGAGNTTPTSRAVKTKTRALTRSQKLAAALKKCRQRPKRRRATCERQARRAYGPAREAKQPAAKRRAK